MIALKSPSRAWRCSSAALCIMVSHHFCFLDAPSHPNNNDVPSSLLSQTPQEAPIKNVRRRKLGCDVCLLLATVAQRQPALWDDTPTFPSVMATEKFYKSFNNSESASKTYGEGCDNRLDPPKSLSQTCRNVNDNVCHCAPFILQNKRSSHWNLHFPISSSIFLIVFLFFLFIVLYTFLKGLITTSADISESYFLFSSLI